MKLSITMFIALAVSFSTLQVEAKRLGERTGRQLNEKHPIGAPCLNDDMCISNDCASGFCRAYEDGQNCGSNEECSGGLCVFPVNPFGYCATIRGLAAGESGCHTHEECETDYCSGGTCIWL